MRIDHREPDLENHDRGLDWDLPRLLERRGLLKLVAGAGLAGAGLVTLGACADDGSTSSLTAATPRAPTGGSPPGGTERPPPGGGPPGGGDNPDGTSTSDTEGGPTASCRRRRPALPGRRFQRGQRAHRERHRTQDITSSFGSSTTMAEGVPLPSP